jgi:hypothetical protein
MLTAVCISDLLDAKKSQVVRSSFRRNYADPNEVAAVILGGGTGTQLFPLTSTRATPAVRQHIVTIHFDCANFLGLFSVKLIDLNSRNE